jgi:hypothetical protein
MKAELGGILVPPFYDTRESVLGFEFANICLRMLTLVSKNDKGVTR